MHLHLTSGFFNNPHILVTGGTTVSAHLTTVHAEPVQLPRAHLYLPVSIVNHVRLYVECKEAGIEKIPKHSNRKS